MKPYPFWSLNHLTVPVLVSFTGIVLFGWLLSTLIHWRLVVCRRLTGWRRHRWHVKWELDVDAMQRALESLVGDHDFSAYTLKDEERSPWISIKEAGIEVAEEGLALVLDTGQWWFDETALPLPLGANAIRKDLGARTIRDVNRLLKQSILYGLEHRQAALDYALGFGRGLDAQQADRFVAMYVNQRTLDFGPDGRRAVAELLQRGHAAGVIAHLVEPEFVEDE